MSKEIRIKLDENNYFEHVVRILKAVPPFSKLRPKELQVYSRLLYHYNKLQDSTDQSFEQINESLFNYDIRRLIQEEIKISDSSYRNILTRLRIINIINENSLKKQFIIEYSEDISFKFFNK